MTESDHPDHPDHPDHSNPSQAARRRAPQRVIIGGVGALRLTLAEVVSVARERAEVALAPGALEIVPHGKSS